MVNLKDRMPSGSKEQIESDNSKKTQLNNPSLLEKLNSENQKLHSKNQSLTEDLQKANAKLAIIADSDKILTDIEKKYRAIMAEESRLDQKEKDLSSRESHLQTNERECNRIKNHYLERNQRLDELIEERADEKATSLVSERTKVIEDSYLKKEKELTDKVNSKVFWKKLEYGSVFILVMCFLIAGTIFSKRFWYNLYELYIKTNNTLNILFREYIPDDWKWIVGIAVLMALVVVGIILLTYFFYFKDDEKFDSLSKWFMVITAIVFIIFTWTDFLIDINLILIWLILQIAMPIIRFIIIPLITGIIDLIDFCNDINVLIYGVVALGILGVVIVAGICIRSAY